MDYDSSKIRNPDNFLQIEDGRDSWPISHYVAIDSRNGTIQWKKEIPREKF